MEIEDLKPGFYFDRTSRDSKLRYVVVFTNDGFKDCFPPRINCLSLEQQARRVVPLDSRNKCNFNHIELVVWVREQLEKYSELNKGVKRGAT